MATYTGTGKVDFLLLMKMVLDNMNLLDLDRDLIVVGVLRFGR